MDSKGIMPKAKSFAQVIAHAPDWVVARELLTSMDRRGIVPKNAKFFARLLTKAPDWAAVCELLTIMDRMGISHSARIIAILKRRAPGWDVGSEILAQVDALTPHSRICVNLVN
jgi:hypothetical protein